MVEVKATGICHSDECTVSGAGAVFNMARVQPGDNVVVFGLGGIGLNVDGIDLGAAIAIGKGGLRVTYLGQDCSEPE